ncbi:GNAT family N-acetyltransferase [Camelimonas abortus]|uniref:GNAT family N-acetyltransferase n=1 Tax=Camelimonas abortus TaxID=1017184 RepID=A0ABV7LF83_9HYPH
MIVIGDETPFETTAREALLDQAMGPDRRLKASERLREGQVPAAGLALAARETSGDGPARLVGTVRLWRVLAGDRPALLLGPLAVATDRQGDGVGGLLMREAIARARALGHGAIILVGDPEYYARFGFSAALTGALAMPGPWEKRRLVALELVAGALAGAAGMIRPADAAEEAAAAAGAGRLRWGVAGRAAA